MRAVAAPTALPPAARLTARVGALVSARRAHAHVSSAPNTATTQFLGVNELTGAWVEPYRSFVLVTEMSSNHSGALNKQRA